MEFKKTYELNMLLPFNADIKVQRDQRERMVVMSFLVNLSLEFDTSKFQILSNSEISSLQDTFSRILHTESSPSVQMSNAFVSRNDGYKSVKQLGIKRLGYIRDIDKSVKSTIYQ